MKTKIYYLLLLCLMVLGRGEVWAAEETFTLSSIESGTSYDQTQNGIRLVIDPGSSGSYFHSSGNGYRLCHSGASLTITTPAGQAVTSLVLTCNNKGNDVSYMAGFTISGNLDWNPFTDGKADSYTWLNSSNVANPITFTTKYSDKGDVYVASITVTTSSVTMQNSTAPTFSVASGTQNPGTVTISAATGAIIYYSTDGWDTTQEATTSVNVPVTKSMTLRATAKEGLNYDTSSEVKATYYVPTTTWDFTQAWSTYTGDLSSEYWNTSSSPIQYKIQYATATSAYVSAGIELPETYGLRFITNNTSFRLGISKNNWIFIHGASSFVIPNLTAGLTVRVTASGYSSSTTMAPTNTTVTTTQNLTTSQTAYTYTVASTGDVSFAFANQAYISKIEVIKTDIASIGSLGGSNKTTEVVGSSNWSYMVTFRNSSNDVMDMSSTEWTSCSLTNSDNSVITISKGGHSMGTGDVGRGAITVTPVAAGTSTVTITFPGSDRYNPIEGTVTFTITKNPQTLSFAENSKEVNYGAAAPTNTLTQTPTQADGGTTVTYSSSDPHVASVDPSTGSLTINNAGTCTITATAAETATYAGASASYTLTVNATEAAPTISLYNENAKVAVANGGSVSTTFNSSITVKGTASNGSTVKYRSGNTAIATVDAKGKITTKNGGTVTIYAYTESNGGVAAAEVSYELTVTRATFSLAFVPTSGTINVGKTITPYTTFPSIYTEDVVSITASSNNTGVATVVNTLWDRNNPDYSNLIISVEADGRHKIMGLKPTITGVTAGSATISLQFESSQYIVTTPAHYEVTVVSGTGINFDWASKADLTMYEGDYMMMPAITGNANGYPFDQNDAQRYVWAMTQNDSKVTWISYYNASYHPGEGEPFYWLTDDSSDDYDKHAYILFAASGETRTGGIPEGLMIYARKEGTVYIHAKDMQLDTELSSTIKLTILPKKDIYGVNGVDGATTDGQLTVEQKTISYPYTWDFTKDFSNADFEANNYYWIKDGTTYRNGLALQNSDFGDDNHSGNKNNQGSDRIFKALLANHNTIPAFKGMKVQLQGSTFDSKYDRLQVKPTAGNGNSHLHVTGGPQVFDLPRPASGASEPSAYKLFVKVKATTVDRGIIRFYKNGTGGGDIKCEYDNADDKESGVKHPFVEILSEEDKDNPEKVAERNAKRLEQKIFSFDYSNGDKAYLGLQDVDVYWIAFSTEAKPIYQPTSTTYPASTYSYPEALDLDKSAESNTGLTTYYAGDYSDGVVTMSPLTGSVESGAGLMLKLPATEETNDDTPNSNCYMIADAKNMDTYSAPTVFTGESALTNYLIGTPESATTPTRFVDISGTKYTNFVLTNTYWKVNDDGTTYGGDDGVTVIDDTPRYDNWKFVRTAGNVVVDRYKAYLQLSGRLLNIGTTVSDGGGASRTILGIIFDDEQDNATGIKNLPEDVSSKTGDGCWYTLQGTKVSTPARGNIYIHNGKKYSIK